jgi:hypothetical protein
MARPVLAIRNIMATVRTPINTKSLFMIYLPLALMVSRVTDMVETL